MAANNRPATNPLANLAAISGQGEMPQMANVGQYVTAAMLAAASSQCTCETCVLMAKAGRLTRESLAREADNGRG